MRQTTVAKRLDLSFGAAKHAGIKRQGKPNQDEVYILRPNLFYRRVPLMVLADGMGGYPGGSEASQEAVKAFWSTFQQTEQVDLQLALQTSLNAAHQKVILSAGQKEEHKNMGTTIVAAAVSSERVVVLNVGDSRAYLVRAGQLTLLSQDHSLMSVLTQSGAISDGTSLSLHDQSVLTQSISARRTSLSPSFGESALLDGDVILLCSDGLWRVVPAEQIAAVAQNFSCQEAADKLIQLAIAYGGPDNVSVALTRVGVYQPATSPAPQSGETNP